jgi:hypothetical protein
MALVNIEQWRRERGFGLDGSAIPQSQPMSTDTSPPDLSQHVAALEAEIIRQADLIQALQTALRSYVERDQAAQTQARPGRTGKIVRRPRFKAKAPEPKPAA